MIRTWKLVLFLLVVVSLTVGLHFYLWTRLVRDPSWPLWAKRMSAALIILLGAWMVALMPLLRVVPRTVGSPLAWVGFVWMGVLMYLSLLLGVLDLIQWGISLRSGTVDQERRMWIARLVAVGSVALSAGIGAWGLFHARRSPRVRPLAVRLTRWPDALSGFRVVQLTDLHIGPTIDGTWLQEVVDHTNALQPDLIAITGDLVDGSVDELFRHVKPLERLRARHGVFFVTGNHEYYAGVDAWIEAVRSLGIRVLRNEHVSITHAGAEFHLAGIDDFHSGSFPGHGPNLPQALAGRNQSLPVLLLAHQPAAIQEAAQHGVDLQLSGHTHGGQVWPWNYLVRLQQPYVAGLHRHQNGNTQIYISSGTGYWGPPMRVGTSAEISLITVHSSTLPLTEVS